MFLVSTNDIDTTFNGVDIVDGLSQISEYFKNIPERVPVMKNVGIIFGYCLDCFPSKFWFCMIIVVICLTISRILRRY